MKMKCSVVLLHTCRGWSVNTLGPGWATPTA